MSSDQHTIGIDLGTTNSVVAVIEDGNPVVIVNAEGQPKTPSVVGFLEDGEIVTGEIARRQGTTQPKRTISSIKRLIGRLKEELDEEGEDYPFELREDERGRVAIVVDDDLYTPEQISALILEKLKTAAEEHLGEEVTRAVITVPAYFDDVQRQATLEAARIAGLEVMRLINEPTAAAMAYGLDKEAQEIVAIYDFGGGTFDFSVLDIDGKTFEVMVSQGNSRLGGDDLDIALVDYVAEKFAASTGIDLRDDMLTLRRLKDEVERVKCELSTSMSSTLSLPFIAYSEGDPQHLEEVITRETLEEVVEPYVEETLECCRKALNESGIRKSVISKVILVGGSTRIPLVQDAVEDFFGIAPFRGVNVDEIVAVGAAMQAAVMDGHLDEVVLLDVTPHTLGIEIKGNRRSILIDRNATIPIKVEKTFTTTEQDQSFVNVHLLQGEEEKGSDNRSLGKFTLSDIPAAAPGVPRIRVEIFVNADGVVELSATETHSGVEKKLAATFAYLDANERRARQGLSGSRRRKRRRRSKQKARAAHMKILEGTSGAERREPAPHGDQVVETLPEIAEPDSTPHESGPVKGKAKPERKSKLKKAKKKDASNRERKVPSSKTAPSAEASSAIEDKTTRMQASQAADTAAKARPKPPKRAPGRAAAAVSPTDRLPEAMTEMALSLEKEADDDKALALYELHRKQLGALTREHEDDESLAAMKVKLLTLTKQPEEARDALVAMRKSWPDREALHYALYGLLCHRYPNYIAARRERAELAQSVGDLKMAMLDLEFVSKRDEADTAIFQTLSDIYEAMLDSGPDSTLQFKLVKVYLRKGALDEAIALLQQMVQEPGNRDQANKVLGLCFWQKGLRYLALQKFKTLRVDDEVKDILYRLGGEMEEKDELLHAQFALERVYETDIGYRDTAERLKKLSYRIDLLKDQRYGSQSLGTLDPNAATIQEPLLGDRFEVLGEINRGSMGIVYKAHDRTLDEIVAIKVLNDYFCTDPQAVERFKKEARSARRLSHENIVRIHDFMSIDDKKLISMEYIEGEDMKAILARNTTFTEDMVMLYLHQICDAMAYAHRLGIVHRDIKPANIMIDERNRVKVTDFGIAKVLDGAATKAGTMIVGTPLYMSPEQIQGGKIDQRADVYALGIMIYELVTGTPPFHEGSIEYQHLHSPVPEITAGISSKLREVIFRCVEKNPDDRFQTIEELTAFLPEIGTPLKK